MPTGKLKRASESAGAAAVRRAIGAGPNEDVTVTTPQFTREPGRPGPASPPADRAAWDALASLDEKALTELGLRRWGRLEERDDGTEVGPMLWLLPGEWYSSIPAGFPIVGLNFERKTFEPGVSDDDIRFGCLPYGIIRAAEEA